MLWFFQRSCVGVSVGPYRRLSTEELMLSNCCAGENSWESLGQQGDQTSQRKSTLNTLERTDVEDEAPILWPPDVKHQLIGKDPDAGKDWRQEENGMAEEKIVRWHHWLSGHDFEQGPGNGERLPSLAYCIPWYGKESDMTEQLKNCSIVNTWIHWYRTMDMEGWL